MGKQQIHFEFEEIIWKQFQELYPRQARKIFEETMKTMINLKLEITDEEGESIKAEKEILQQKADDIISQLQHHDMKLRIWEAKKREELLIKKKIQEAEDDEANAVLDSLKASGMLAR